MTTDNPSGPQRLWNGGATKWIVGISSGAILLLASTGLAYTMGRLTTLENQQDLHQVLDGHPVMEERVEDISEDAARIEGKIDAVAEEVNKNHDALIEQTIVLDQINRKVNGND